MTDGGRRVARGDGSSWLDEIGEGDGSRNGGFLRSAREARAGNFSRRPFTDPIALNTFFLEERVWTGPPPLSTLSEPTAGGRPPPIQLCLGRPNLSELADTYSTLSEPAVTCSIVSGSAIVCYPGPVAVYFEVIWDINLVTC